MLKLYDYFRSTACFRVRIALNLKNLDYTTVPIHLVKNGGKQHSVNYTHVNPQNLVPALEDKQHVLTQSIAIIEYLNEVYPEPNLLPETAYERALVRAFSLAIVADIHPLNNLRVLNYLTQDLQINDSKKNAWYHHWMHKGLQALEEMLPEDSKDFCFGNTPTLADICLVPNMFNARRFNCELANYPKLVRIDKNCQQLDAFKKAWPVEETA